MAAPASELVALFDVDDDHDTVWQPRYSIAPTDQAPIIRARVVDEAPERTLELGAWGLRPAWAKQGGPRPINARIETVGTNGMFRTALAKHRCVVPMSGYYEWTAETDGKQPHYLASPAPVLAAAGLAAARKDADGSWSISYTIVTREARDAGGEVHDRMPAFLPAALVGDWLDPAGDGTALVDHLRAASDEVSATIAVHPVSRQVNNVRTVDPSDPDLIAPVSDA